MRLEHDGLGQMELPEEAYWGIVSERNRKAFDVGPLTLDNYPSYIRAIALCKIACARANAEIGALDPEKAKFIEKLCRQHLQRIRHSCQHDRQRSYRTPR